MPKIIVTNRHNRPDSAPFAKNYLHRHRGLPGVSVLAALVLAACADLKAIAQGSIDQHARNEGAPSAQAMHRVFHAQIPEDALRMRDRQLAEMALQLGRKIAKGYRPKSRIEINVASQDDADWLIAHVDRGIAQTEWPREAVMLPPRVRLSNTYPTVSVVENLR